MRRRGLGIAATSFLCLSTPHVKKEKEMDERWKEVKRSRDRQERSRDISCRKIQRGRLRVKEVEMQGEREREMQRK